MQKKILWIGLALVLASSLQVNAQYAKTDSTYKRWFVGSTLFLLGNLATTNPPNFVQLNIGYRITGKDVITIEPKTWKYAWPNGIHPFLNKSYGKPEEKFPGYVREFGLSVAYQRFLWKGLNAELNVMPSLQDFVNDKGKITLENDIVYSVIHMNENTYALINNQGIYYLTIEIMENKIISGRATMYKTPMLETPINTKPFFTFTSE